MTITQLQTEARAIWGDETLSLAQIIVRLGVDVGKLCRYERNADKDHATHTDEELQTALGNMLFSLIRWTDDLGFDPEHCIALAKERQRRFVEQNARR